MKRSNDYSRAFGALFDRTPKAVFAAVAYSYCSAGGDLEPAQAIAGFLREWDALYANGFDVPRPLASLRRTSPTRKAGRAS